jgi:hypothetical protein
MSLRILKTDAQKTDPEHLTSVLVEEITLPVMELVLSGFDAEDMENGFVRSWAARLCGLSNTQQQILLQSPRYWQVFWLQWTATAATDQWPEVCLRCGDERHILSQVDARPLAAIIGEKSFNFDASVFLYNTVHNDTRRAGVQILPKRSSDLTNTTQHRALIYVRTPRLGVYLTDMAEHCLSKLLYSIFGPFL